MNLTSMINRALDVGISSLRSFSVNPLWGQRVTTPIPLIAAAQAFTAGWVALGPELAVDGYTRATLWLTLDINDGANMRVRCIGRHTSGGNDYMLPIYNPNVGGTPYNILVEGEYCEFNVDADARYALTWDVSNTFPFIQFQIQAGTVGASACEVDDANVTYGWGS